MKVSAILAAILASALFLTSCSKDDKDDKKKEGLTAEGSFLTQALTEAQKKTLTVVDPNGLPIAGADVLIGTELDQPFASNFLQTNAAGIFQAPEAWVSNQIITISAKGYVRASFMGQIPAGQTFQLRAVPAATQPELQGKGTGFALKDGDKIMDFALMMPAVRKSEMLTFNLDMFISPKTDRVTVYGKAIDLPSNTSIPKQKENYGIFPVTMDKALYRLYFEQPGAQKVVTIHGQFPFKTVVDELQGGKTFVDVLNYFTFKGGSLKDVQITLPTQTLDLPIGELVFNQPRALKTPAYAADEFILAAAMSPWQDQYFPTDFKNVPSNSTFNLNTAAGDAPYLLVALKKKSEQMMISGKLSAAFVPFDAGVAPTLLPLIASPTVTAYNEFSLVLPVLPQGFAEVGSYMTYSTVEKTGTGAEAKEKVTRLWEVYSDSWMTHVTLPKWPGEVVPTMTKRWDVLLMANQTAQANNPVAISPRVFETVTHATHSATDF